jgi:molybdopterin-binding protein
MKLSTRNQLPGTVVSVTKGAAVLVLVKSTEVALAVD